MRNVRRSFSVLGRMDRFYREGHSADGASCRCGSWDDMSVVIVCCLPHASYCCVLLGEMYEVYFMQHAPHCFVVDQPGKIVIPSRGQLNGIFLFPYPCSHLATRSRLSFSTHTLNLVLAHGIPPAFGGDIFFFTVHCYRASPDFIRPRNTAYRWPMTLNSSLARRHRDRASSPQSSSSNAC